MCFIIPGVIAYAVDFSNGTIYLPGTATRKGGLERRDLRAVKFDARNATPDRLKKILHDETGYDLDWQDKRLRVIKLKNRDEIQEYLLQDAQTALMGTKGVPTF